MTIMQRLLLIVILAAVPIGLLQALSVRDEQREESTEVTQMALGIAQRAAAEQRRITEGARHLLVALAQLPAVRERDRSCSMIMRRLREQFEIYTVIGVADSAGRVWCSTAEPGTEVGDRPYFRQAVSSGEFTTGGYVIGRATGKRTLNFSLPYFDDNGKLLGVLITGLDLDRLASDLGSAQLPSASDVAIFGPDRHLLVHLPGGEGSGTTMPASFEAAFDATSPHLAEMAWLDGSDRLVAIIPPTANGEMPFLIAVGISRTEALGRVETSARHGFLVLLSVVVGGVLLAWWFASRYVRRPVQQLAATVRAWREGNPYARVGPLHPGSEFDDLAGAFDAMADTVEERQRRLQDALESTTDIVTALAPDWTITFLNRHAVSIINGEDVVGKQLWDAFPELLELSLGDALKCAMTERRKVSATFEYERLGAHFETTAFPANDGGLILYSRNVTDAVCAQEALRQLALFDPLTGLPNRSHAMEIAKDKAGQGQLSALLLLDLDGFKHINDSFGHPAGDEMLREVALRLASCVGDHGVTARLGGDEFVTLLFGMPGKDCLHLAGQILRAVEREPFVVRGQVHRATTSCGIVLADAEDGPSVEELMANADIALYRAKAAGGGVWRAYDVADRDAYEARQRLEAEVAIAATSGQFELYYQPQIRLEDGALVGAEALLRWRHPERGLLLPDAFIDVLDTSRHAAALGDWIIEEACQQAARWWRSGKRLRVSVNIFSQQLRSGDLPRLVKQVLTRHNLPPEALELELTERIALEDEAGAKSTLQMLSLLGVRLAFDDFGTGFASLTTLKDLPVNRIKIDRAFVTHLPTNEHDQAIVEAVLALARTLDMDVVAEGVETAAQEAYLRSSGCQEAQGFRYARPMSASAFNAHILSAPGKAAAG